MHCILQGICSCDERCRILGDCCVDAPRECFGAENDWADYFLPGDDKSWKEFQTIQAFEMRRTLRNIPDMGVYMFLDYRFIDRCPKKAPYSRECEFNFLYKTPIHMLPVCHPSSSLLFANRFCAACHGFNFEDTVSFHQRIPVCDQWVALNHTKENLLEDGTGAYELPKLCSVEWSLFPPTKCIDSTVRNRLYDMLHHNDNDIRNPCLYVKNPVYTIRQEGQLTITKNKHCFPNSSMPWQCYENAMSAFPDPPGGDWNEAVDIWVDRDGKLQVGPVTTDKTARGKCSFSRPFLLILALSLTGFSILARWCHYPNSIQY